MKQIFKISYDSFIYKLQVGTLVIYYLERQLILIKKVSSFYRTETNKVHLHKVNASYFSNAVRPPAIKSRKSSTNILHHV